MIKHVLITGSTGGIGSEIANQLAQSGWNLILLNRSEEKTHAQIKMLKSRYSGLEFCGYFADFLDLEQVQKAVAAVAQNHPRIHALYNNAGFLSAERVTSAQGLEAHFAVNTMVPFLVSKLLASNLSAASEESHPSVIVNFSSSAINGLKKLDVSMLANPEKIGGLMGAYANSKLAINTLVQATKNDLERHGVLIVSMDPGPTKSEMTDKGDGMPWFVKLIRPLVFKPAEEQARKLIHSVEHVVSKQKTGLYVSAGLVKKEHKIATEAGTQHNLLELLESLAEPSMSNS